MVASQPQTIDFRGGKLAYLPGDPTQQHWEAPGVKVETLKPGEYTQGTRTNAVGGFDIVEGSAGSQPGQSAPSNGQPAPGQPYIGQPRTYAESQDALAKQEGDKALYAAAGEAQGGEPFEGATRIHPHASQRMDQSQRQQPPRAEDNVSTRMSSLAVRSAQPSWNSDCRATARGTATISGAKLVSGSGDPKRRPWLATGRR
jgi:hypothetical protein